MDIILGYVYCLIFLYEVFFSFIY